MRVDLQDSEEAIRVFQILCILENFIIKLHWFQEILINELGLIKDLSIEIFILSLNEVKRVEQIFFNRLRNNPDLNITFHL